MAIIGAFTLSKDGGWTGSIRTLNVDAKLRLIPNDNRTSEHAPAFRVFAGQSHVAEAWEACSSSEPLKPYLRVRLDDPSFAEPISAALFPSMEGADGQLVWSRRSHGV